MGPSDVGAEEIRERAEAARYGLTVGDVQQVVTSGIGGENIVTNVEGRERYPVNIRYNRDFRDDIEALRRVVVIPVEIDTTLSQN